MSTQHRGRPVARALVLAVTAAVAVVLAGVAFGWGAGDDAGAPAAAVAGPGPTTSDGGPAPTSAPATSAPPASLPVDRTTEPLTLQTVPVTAGLVVDVDGRQVVTDAAGTIVLDGADLGGRISVLGVEAASAQHVQFVGWSDGHADATRAAASLHGPIAEIALDVKELVTVTVGDDQIVGGWVSFDSSLGVIDVPIDGAMWITAARAVPGECGLRVERPQYTATAVTIGAIRADAVTQRYTPTAKGAVDRVDLTDAAAGGAPLAWSEVVDGDRLDPLGPRGVGSKLQHLAVERQLAVEGGAGCWRPAGSRAARPRRRGRRRPTPLARTASTIISDWFGGTTSSSRPWNTASGTSIRVDMEDRRPRPCTRRGRSGHGPINPSR